MKEPSDQFHRWIERLEEVEYTIEVRKGVNHGNADGLSRMLCEGKNCICEPVQLLERQHGGADDHEVIYAEQRTDNQDSEQPLLHPSEGNALLQQRLRKRPQKQKKNRCVNFQQAQRGETGTDEDNDIESCNSPIRSDQCSQTATKNKKRQRFKRATASQAEAEQLSDGITADAEDNDHAPVVRSVRTFATAAATQTGDTEHQQSDAQERQRFARAVRLGTLWTRDELIQAQLADVDLQPVYNAKLSCRVKTSLARKH